MSSWTKVCSFIVLFFFVSSCVYTPVVDFRGSEKMGADLERYDDDLSSCRKIAEKTIPWNEYLILPQDTEKALIIKRCLKGRGWSVVY